MDFLNTTVVSAVVAGVFSVIGSILALRGRESEVKSTQTQTLITGQDNRIARLEDRLDKVEKQLWAEMGKSSALANALETTVTYVVAVEAFFKSGMTGDPPKSPDISQLRRVLENARNPPDGPA